MNCLVFVCKAEICAKGYDNAVGRNPEWSAVAPRHAILLKQISEKSQVIRQHQVVMRGIGDEMSPRLP
jgi:hypothetical protein